MVGSRYGRRPNPTPNPNPIPDPNPDPKAGQKRGCPAFEFFSSFRTADHDFTPDINSELKIPGN